MVKEFVLCNEERALGLTDTGAVFLKKERQPRALVNYVIGINRCCQFDQSAAIISERYYPSDAKRATGS